MKARPRMDDNRRAMTTEASNPYFRTQVLTASPERLRLMLIEGGIRFLRSGRDAMAARQWEKMHDAFTSARNIIVELSGSLRPEIAPELCDKLASLYNYMLRLTIEGSFDKKPEKIDEAIRLLDYDRETWAMLIEKLARERGGGEGAANARPDEPGERAPIALSA